MKNSNSHQFEYDYLRKSTPILSYREDIDFAQWKDTIREKLTDLLGLPLEMCDPEFDIEYKKQKEGFWDYRFTVQTEPGYHVPCHLLVPDTGKAKYPLTVCLMGHGSGMHLVLGESKCDSDTRTLHNWPHRAMGLRAIRDGRCALAIEARNFGESSLEGYGTSCTEAAKIALLMGRTVIGERVWDVMRILDAVAANFPQVDMDGIVCTGNSGGGTATYYLACLDERIAAAAPSCSICSYETSIAAMPHCMCNHIPQIRKYFEMGDLAALIAPRKLVIAAGELDDIFPIDGTRETFQRIRQIYKAAGAEDNCALVVGEKGHLNYADLIWEKLREIGIS